MFDRLQRPHVDNVTVKFDRDKIHATIHVAVTRSGNVVRVGTIPWSEWVACGSFAGVRNLMEDFNE